MTAPRYPTIEIDASKCTVPFDCKKCLQACPQAVFLVTAVKVERDEAKNYSYELNPDMLKLLREEFDVDKVTSKFAEAIKGKSAGEIEAEGKAIFEEYGRNWIRQSLKLGEEYPDRTYEVLLEAIDKTGGY
ncbi:MAG: hypothetical protein JRF41_11325 [Deltaproteobacteria bacterium]|nr:hypothetical protein [Deltaproteobacteria bacterium]